MLQRIGQNFGAQLLGLGLSFVDRFLVIGLLLRAWGTQTYADWAVILATTGLIALCEFGLNIYFGNLFQRANVRGDRVGFQRAVSTALYYSGCLASLLSAMALLTPWLIDFKQVLSIRSLSANETKLIFYLLAATCISRIARGGITQIYRGRQQFARGTVVDLLATGTTTASTITAALLGMGPIVIAAAYLACDLAFGWGVMLLDQNRRFPDIRHLPARPTGAEVADLFHHVRWLAIQQGAPVAWLQAPVLILGVYGTAGNALVSFLIIRVMVNFARQFGTMLSIAAGVEFASYFHSDKPEVAGRQIEALGAFLSALTMAISVATLFFGEPFVKLWTGHPDLFNREIVTALLAGALISAPATPMGQIMTLSHRPRPAAIAGMIQLVVGLSACAALGSTFGALGVAGGLTAGEALANGVMLPIMGARQAGMRYLPYLARCLLVMAASAVWCSLTAKLVLSIIPPSSTLRVVLAGGVWSLTGMLPVMIAALPTAQLSMILRRLKR